MEYGRLNVSTFMQYGGGPLGFEPDARGDITPKPLFWCLIGNAEIAFLLFD